MKYQALGNTGFMVSRVGYGGVVSSQHFDKAVLAGDGQRMSDEAVALAIEKGVNYFDVAPSYGDAQLLMGNSIRPYREKIYLACKTNKREAEEARREVEESLRLLHTDHFDVYQLHGLATMEELETCFAPGGAMEVLEDLKKKGTARKIGFTAHSEEVALRALKMYDFDTVMFPLNWHMHLAHGMGERISRAVKEKGAGLLGIKSMIRSHWEGEEERYSSAYPKSWARPFDIQTEPQYLIQGMKYTLSLGVDVLIPPGNVSHLAFALEHIDEVVDHPEVDRALLEELLPKVCEKPFFEPSCYA